MTKDSPLPLHRTVRGRAVLASVLAGMGLVSTGMAMLIPVNEYRAALGIQGAYDCDGPDSVATFVIMALACLVPAALVAAWTLLNDVSVGYCGLFCTRIVGNVIQDIPELDTGGASPT